MKKSVFLHLIASILFFHSCNKKIQENDIGQQIPDSNIAPYDTTAIDSASPGAKLSTIQANIARAEQLQNDTINKTEKQEETVTNAEKQKDQEKTDKTTVEKIKPTTELSEKGTKKSKNIEEENKPKKTITDTIKQ